MSAHYSFTSAMLNKAKRCLYGVALCPIVNFGILSIAQFAAVSNGLVVIPMAVASAAVTGWVLPICAIGAVGFGSIGVTSLIGRTAVEGVKAIGNKAAYSANKLIPVTPVIPRHLRSILLDDAIFAYTISTEMDITPMILLYNAKGEVFQATVENPFYGGASIFTFNNAEENTTTNTNNTTSIIVFNSSILEARQIRKIVVLAVLNDTSSDKKLLLSLLPVEVKKNCKIEQHGEMVIVNTTTTTADSCIGSVQQSEQQPSQQPQQQLQQSQQQQQVVTEADNNTSPPPYQAEPNLNSYQQQQQQSYDINQTSYQQQLNDIYPVDNNYNNNNNSNADLQHQEQYNYSIETNNNNNAWDQQANYDPYEASSNNYSYNDSYNYDQNVVPQYDQLQQQQQYSYDNNETNNSSNTYYEDNNNNNNNNNNFEENNGEEDDIDDDDDDNDWVEIESNELSKEEESAKESLLFGNVNDSYCKLQQQFKADPLIKTFYACRIVKVRRKGMWQYEPVNVAYERKFNIESATRTDSLVAITKQFLNEPSNQPTTVYKQSFLHL